MEETNWPAGEPGTHQSDRYHTADTAEAGWLYSRGFELLDVQVNSFIKDRKPSIFIFKNNSPELNRAAFLFQCGQAEGNILSFFRAYKKMLARARGR